MTIYADNGENSKLIIDFLSKFVDFNVVYDMDSTNLLCLWKDKLPIVQIGNRYFNFNDTRILFNIK